MYTGYWRGCGEKNALEVWFLVVLRTELAEVRIILKVIAMTHMSWWDSIEKTMGYPTSRRRLLNWRSCSIVLECVC
jgi:hypothetical protein